MVKRETSKVPPPETVMVQTVINIFEALKYQPKIT
jgi:hypothetical protein